MIRIILENFKCWEQKTIDFPSNGIVLLNGKSGVGKTSILQAIYFVLYGKGNKLVRFGSSGKISVTMDTGELRIKRSKKPNRFTVKIKKTGLVLEDKAAQGYINSVFGSHFEITSYIQQKGLNSFLTSSPSEKLEFLEKMIMTNFDVSTFKTELKSSITELNMKLNNLQGKNSVLESVVSTLKESFMNVKSSDTYKANVYKSIGTVEELEEKRKIWNIKLSNGTKAQHREEKKMVEIDEKISIDNQNKVMKKSLCIRAEKLIEKNEGLSKNKEKLEKQLIVQDIVEECNKLKQKRDTYYESIQYQTLLKQFEDMYKEEKDTLTEKLSKITYFEPWMYLSEKECDANIEALIEKNNLEKQIKKLQKTLETPEINSEDLKAELASLEKDLELINVYQCPHCNNSIVMVDNIVKKSTKVFKSIKKDELKSKIKELKTRIEKVKKQEFVFKQSYNEIEALQKKFNAIQLPKDLDLVKYRDENIEFERLLECESELNRECFDSYPNLKKLKVKMSKFKTDCVSLNIKEIETKIQEYQDQIQKNNMTRKELNLLEQAIAEYNKEYSSLIKEINQLVVEEEDVLIVQKYMIQKALQAAKDKIELSNQRLAMLQDQEQILSLKSKYLIEKSKYKANQLKEKETSLLIVQRKTILQKAVQAESLVLENLIETLNIEINRYLEAFFTIPIYVELNTFKELKSKVNKPCINVSIKYNGEDNYDITSLSGGEFDRLQLAFTLAFSEIFSTSILMFDESISSLDASTTEYVLKQMKDTSKSKLILVIAHQSIHGIFDQTIDF